MSSTAVVETDTRVPLGLSVPPFTPHAISVSLPTWRDNVGYEEGEKRVIDAMVSGYPRFFIHLSIQKLQAICEQKYATGNERCMLFPTQNIAQQCRVFIERRASDSKKPVIARLVHLFICPEDNRNDGTQNESSAQENSVDLHIVLFPEDIHPIAKQFWQHTGLGISSRLAEKCLAGLGDDPSRCRPTSSSMPKASKYPSKGPNRYYAVNTQNKSPSPPARKVIEPDVSQTQVDNIGPDHDLYLEERYGRNLPLSAATSAKRTLRRRVAGVLIRDHTSTDLQNDLPVGPSTRGVTDVTEDDVFLFPTGMAAIWNAHQLALSVRPLAKSVCFGFPYTDTLKVLEKWGPGCHFFGFGVDSDIDKLQAVLEEEVRSNPNRPPILALFTEFPSNPLLRSANLPRLRALADEYDFLIVIDETIGNFVNVEVLPFADIVVSSLTKVFSGASNVMGGSLVLNPRGRHYPALKKKIDADFEDTYCNEDAIYMERNSRDFERRIRTIDVNTEAICDFLRSRSQVEGSKSPAIKEVFYPKYITRTNYELCRIKKQSEGEDARSGGFGGLFSLNFTSTSAAKAFFDTLPCFKGPSLGTNFTLACPYTILAHYLELDWAAQFGVGEDLVRISVGMEDTDTLLTSFELALNRAEEVAKVGSEN